MASYTSEAPGLLNTFCEVISLFLRHVLSGSGLEVSKARGEHLCERPAGGDGPAAGPVACR